MENTGITDTSVMAHSAQVTAMPVMVSDDSHFNRLEPLLAQYAERVSIASGEHPCRQDYVVDGVYLLIQGAVRVSLPADDEHELALYLQDAAKTKGGIVGLEFFTDAERYLCNYTCVTQCDFYYLSSDALDTLLSEQAVENGAPHSHLLQALHEHFYLSIHRLHRHCIEHLAEYLPHRSDALTELLELNVSHDDCYWGLSVGSAGRVHQILISHLVLLAQWPAKYGVAFASLVKFHAESVHLTSPLYLVAQFLHQRQSQPLAIELLHDIVETGKEQERYLAELCLIITSGIEEDILFYNQLCNIYDQAVYQGAELEETIAQNAVNFQALYQQGYFHLEGMDNLPDEGGNIFILNHLISHPYHQLPNGYELSLDTSFVSSMVLYPKYNKAGVRVVRNSYGHEIGHQHYYGSFDHIMVQTAESEPIANESEADKRARRQDFYAQVEEVLSAGDNLIICPEGTSRWQFESPGEFRLGSFVIPLKLKNLKKAPKIIPLAMAHFDKSIKNSVPSVYVGEPIDMMKLLAESEHPKETQLEEFVKTLNQGYRERVEEAESMAFLAGGAKRFLGAGRY